VRIGDIVDQTRRAVGWLVREGPARGANAANLVVGGHSAGGHLAAMLFTTDWGALGHSRDTIRAGISVSGLHDLEPLVQFSFNVDLRLDHAEALRLSPMLLEPRSHAPLLLAVGADETSEFIRQTRVQWDAWPDNRPPSAQAPMLIAGRDHFTVVLDYADGASELTQASLALF
jgi:arylformamidase